MAGSCEIHQVTEESVKPRTITDSELQRSLYIMSASPPGGQLSGQDHTVDPSQD